MNYFFTSDEHYSHSKVIEYCKRPFSSIAEMNEVLIDKHNAKVNKNDVVVHVGDFCFKNSYYDAKKIIDRLNGSHIFIKGSHDKWMKPKEIFIRERWGKMIKGQYVTADHYAGRVWPRSHYGSWLVYGHSHGGLPSFGKSYDVGVDNNNFEPVSFDELSTIMAKLDDNFNLIRR